MSLAIYTSAAWTNNGGLKVADNATIEVRRESDGALAAIYSDRAGTQAITNPSEFGDASGRFQFFAAGGAYRVKVTQDGEEHTLRYQAIGTAGEFDASAVSQAVDSVEDLRTSTFPASLERLWLSGYYGVGTAGGGPLYRDDESSEDDNGSTVFVDADGVRWKTQEISIEHTPYGTQEEHEDPPAEGRVARLDRLHSAGIILGVSSPLTVTVGTGEDYSNLGEALAYLSRKRRLFGNTQPVKVLLKTGFVLSEEIHLVGGVDLGWVSIESEDAEVVIDRSSIVTSLGDYGATLGVPLRASDYAAFAALGNSTLPLINVLFNMDTSGVSRDSHGFVVNFSSRATIGSGAGCKNASPSDGGRGLWVSSSSVVNTRGGIFDGCYRGIRVANNSMVQARGCSATDCTQAGGFFSTNSVVNAEYSDFSRAASTCLVAVNSTRVNFSFATANDADVGVSCVRGSFVSMHDSIATGNTNNDAQVLFGSQIVITDGQTSSGGSSPHIDDTNLTAFNAIEENMGIIWN